MFGEWQGVGEGFPSAESFERVFVVVQPYARKQESPDCRPPLIVAECYSGLMVVPRREEGRLVEVRRLLLQVWACVGDRNVRRAEALHRVRDAGADFEEPLLVTYRRLDVSLDPQMVFGVVGFFRVDRGLYVRREVLPPGARKSIKLRREQI